MKKRTVWEQLVQLPDPHPPQMNPKGEMTMKPDYRNWMPREMIIGLGTAAGVLAAGSATAFGPWLPWSRMAKNTAGAALGLGAMGCLAGTAWSLYAREMFSYEGGRQLSRQIVEGVAAYITLPEGGVGLDVGAYFSVRDAEKELTSWSNRISVSSRGYMLGYQDLWGPGIRNIHRLLARIADGPMKLQIVRLDFREDSR